jgi:hypothetical protein
MILPRVLRRAYVGACKGCIKLRCDDAGITTNMVPGPSPIVATPFLTQVLRRHECT